jgi:hypothetical protein
LNLVLGGDICASHGMLGFVLEGDGGASGGAEADTLDFLGAVLLRDARALGGEGFTGDDDSAPDWKMLLSSHPLSSACQTDVSIKHILKSTNLHSWTLVSSSHRRSLTVVTVS